MAKASNELISARREEIIKVCGELYRTTGMKDISLKRIGDETSMTRTTIYNYFKTKEDIFIVMLQREIETWVAQLEAAFADRETMTAEEIAHVFAGTLEERGLMLRLVNVEWIDLISNSSPECLDEVRVTFGEGVKAADALIAKLDPPMTEDERQSFAEAFFPFLFGLYTCAFPVEEHRELLESAGVSHIFKPTYDLVYNCVSDLIHVRTAAAPAVQPEPEPEPEPEPASEPEPAPEPEPVIEPQEPETPEPPPVVEEPKPAKKKAQKPLSAFRWERKSKKSGSRRR